MALSFRKQSSICRVKFRGRIVRQENKLLAVASVGRPVDERWLAALSAECTCLERRVHFNKQQLLIGKVNKRQQSSAGSPMQPSSTIGHRHSKCQVDRPRGLPVCIATVATQKPVTHWWRPTTGPNEANEARGHAISTLLAAAIN